MNLPRVASVSPVGCFGCHFAIPVIHDWLDSMMRRVELDRSPRTGIKTVQSRGGIVIVERGRSIEQGFLSPTAFLKDWDALAAPDQFAITRGLPARLGPTMLADGPLLPPTLIKVHQRPDVLDSMCSTRAAWLRVMSSLRADRPVCTRPSRILTASRIGRSKGAALRETRPFKTSTVIRAKSHLRAMGRSGSDRWTRRRINRARSFKGMFYTSSTSRCPSCHSLSVRDRNATASSMCSEIGSRWACRPCISASWVVRSSRRQMGEVHRIHGRSPRRSTAAGSAGAGDRVLVEVGVTPTRPQDALALARDAHDVNHVHQPRKQVVTLPWP